MYTHSYSGILLSTLLTMNKKTHLKKYHPLYKGFDFVLIFAHWMFFQILYTLSENSVKWAENPVIAGQNEKRQMDSGY
jgi:hypothetical protein